MDAILDYRVVQQTAATLLRLFLSVVASIPNPHPDEVLQISSREPGRYITSHVYKSNATQRPTPTLINFHGSGFMLPRHGEEAAFCRQVCAEAKYTVIDCAYRLSPETPFPGAFEDVEDVIKYVLGHPEQYDPKSLSISGFSAGANLALVAASTLFRDTFQSVVAFYPVTDFSISAYDKTWGPDRSAKPLLPPFLLQLFLKSYIQANPVSMKDPRLSPAFTPVECFPKRNLFITAAHDNLCQEAESLAARLAEVNPKRGECIRMELCNHAFDKNPAVGSVQEEMTKKAYSRVVEFLNE